VSDGACETILQLRQLFGDPLAGTALEEDQTAGVQQFTAALEQIVASQLPVPPLPAAPVQPPCRACPSSIDVAYSEFAPTDGPLQTAALRLAARSLDQTANDLEEQALFAEADELRAAATRLRARARLSSCSTAQRPLQ
jgi:hypothetical protein